MTVKVGQIYHSTRPQDIQNGWNQWRAVLALTTKRHYAGFDREAGQSRYEESPAAVLSCDGNGGKMRSTVRINAKGELSGHSLVSEPDGRIIALAEVFRGITTRPPYGYYDKYPYAGDMPTSDLADEVLEVLLWPRTRDGSENPRIELVLHQDALAAVAERLVTLTAVVEQNAAAQATDFLSAFEQHQRSFDEATDFLAEDEAAHAEFSPGEFEVMEP